MTVWLSQRHSGCPSKKPVAPARNSQASAARPIHRWIFSSTSRVRTLRRDFSAPGPVVMVVASAIAVVPE